MTITEKIIQHLKSIPEAAQEEILDFIEFLETKVAKAHKVKEQEDWSAFSLAQAIRGMEDEPVSYSTEDIKEVF